MTYRVYKPLPRFGVDDEGEPLARVAVRSTADDVPWWRQGAASFTVRERGTRGYPDGTGPRRDLGVAAEWRWLTRPGFGWGWQLRWGTNASETTPDLGVYLGALGTVWVHLEHVLPWSWLERHKPDGRDDYTTREFGVRLSAERAEWQWWAPANEWSSTAPWWQHPSVAWRTLLLGMNTTTNQVVDGGTCVVPMPERSYPATYEVVRHEHRYLRPLGRLRDAVLGPRVHRTWTVTPGAGIPVPGKGENSWDCGDDQLLSASGGSLDDAIANLVRSALRYRRTYGGEHMSVPS